MYWNWVFGTTVVVALLVIGYRQFCTWRRITRELKDIRAERAALRNLHIVDREGPHSPPELRPEPAEQRLNRSLIYLVVTALCWVMARVWMDHYAIAQAMDTYEFAESNGNRQAMCQAAGNAVGAFLKAGDDERYNDWRLKEREACR